MIQWEWRRRTERLPGLSLKDPAGGSGREHRPARHAQPFINDFAPRPDQLQTEDAVLLWRRAGQTRRIDRPGGFQCGDDSVRKSEGRHAPILHLDVTMDQVRHLRFHLYHFAPRQPPELIEPVNSFIYKSSARRLPWVSEPAGRPGAIPVFRN